MQFPRTAKPTLVAMELLQLHDLQPSEHAAAEKHDMAHEAMEPKAGRAIQLIKAPIVTKFLSNRAKRRTAKPTYAYIADHKTSSDVIMPLLCIH